MADTDLNTEIASVQTALNQAVVAKECLAGPEYEFDGLTIDDTRFCGIGMYIPEAYNPYVTSKTSWNTYYENLLHGTVPQDGIP